VVRYPFREGPNHVIVRCPYFAAYGPRREEGARMRRRGGWGESREAQ